jgi:hypothetical protein
MLRVKIGTMGVFCKDLFYFLGQPALQDITGIEEGVVRACLEPSCDLGADL